MAKWQYCGDVDLMNGGYFWREDGADDYVLCVRVTACADAGGPGNMCWVEAGSIYLGTAAQRRAALIDAVLAHQGIDKDAGATVRVGPVDPFYNGRERIEPDTVLRSNASLKNWLKRQGWLS